MSARETNPLEDVVLGVGTDPLRDGAALERVPFDEGPGTAASG
jgi:hypothetical protein